MDASDQQRRAEPRGVTRLVSDEPSAEWLMHALDRKSSVPLYYQLQEIIHQQIGSGRFSVGDALPSEGDFCRMFGVSRMVVRQALQVLEDDGEIERLQGKGTYVAEPKLDLIAGGLVRVLSAQNRGAQSVEILDCHQAPIQRSVGRKLGETNVLRVDWLLRVRDLPMAIAYSFLRPGVAPSLENAAIRGVRLAGQQARSLAIDLRHSEVSVSTSHCSPYNAERLGIAPRAPVFLVDATEFAQTKNAAAEAVEVARVVYRSDALALRLEATTDGGVQQISARLSSITGGA
jgi:GntR family transcriptional regulator